MGRTINFSLKLGLDITNQDNVGTNTADCQRTSMNADFFYGLLFQGIYILIHIPAVLLFMRAFDPYARMFPFTKRNFEKV